MLKKKTVAVISVAALAATTMALPAAAASMSDNPVQVAACNPCAAKKGCSPCAAKKGCNPCSPCAAKKGCSPCAAKKGCNPCNPCSAKKN